jgi:hypothetical protein
MPQRKHLLRLVGRVFFLAAIGWVLALARAVHRSRRGWEEWSEDESEWNPVPLPEDDESNETPAAARRPFRARVALSSAFVLIFFAAATFTAGAGDLVAKAIDPARCAALMQTTGQDETVCAQVVEEQATPVEAPVVEAPAPEASTEDRAAAPEAPAPEAPAATPEAPAPAPEAQPTDAATEAPAADASTETSTEVAPETATETTTDAATATETETAPAAEAAPANAPAPAVDKDDSPSSYVLAPQVEPAKSKKSSRHWVVRRAKESKAKEPVVEHEGGAPTVWLNRALPDPTPPAKRLSPKFAKKLQRISAINGVSWALVLGVLRAEGARDRNPATVKELNALARGLRTRGAVESEWNAALALSGRSSFADRAVSLARYNRAVGLSALVTGLEAAQDRLTTETLADPRVHIYGGGRDDLENGRIDVRVVVLIRYVAESYGEVTVSSLFSGHRKYARPGVVSAHIYGHAVDIAAVGGVSILGHSQPGSITEKAVRSILMLPVEVQPRQVISLLGLGGASFPLANHANHIHVGY